jgi:transposase
MYTANPNMPKVRRLAVNDVLYRGFTQESAANKYGVTRSAICKWLKRAPFDHRVFIETKSSRPHNHLNQLSFEVIEEILRLKKTW